MTSPYFFLRPILAADRSWVALDWQSANPLSTDGDDLVRSFAESAAAPLADMLSVVMLLNPACLERDEFVNGFDASHVVFVLPGSSLDDANTLDRCTQLRKQGNRFGLQLDSAERLRKVPVALFDYLSLDASFARQDLSVADLNYAGAAGFQKIASNVGTHEMFRWLSGNGIDWSSSQFLAARDPQLGNEPDLTRLKLLKLLNLVRNDGDTREIEGVFREEPKLSYNLLRLVNSVAVGARTKISSFSQAIAILGRRQLQRWLQLLIYANNLAGGNAPNPLMQLAASRGRQMELLCAAIEPRPDIPDLCDNAFMTGLFSLLDILINLPMSEILKELPLEDEVMEALKSPAPSGVLGHVLAAIAAGEAGNFAAAETLLSGLGISPATHTKAQVTALYWAARINMQNES